MVKQYRAIIQILITAVLGTCLGPFSGLAAPVPMYKLIFLPTNSQMKAIYPTDLNNLGDVVGYWQTARGLSETGSAYAFLFSNRTMVDLNPLIGGIGNTVATAINDHRKIIGTYVPSSNNGTPSGFIFSLDDGMQPLTAGQLSTPKDINNSGQIAGYTTGIQNQSCGSSSACPAVFLHNGTIVFLEMPSNAGSGHALKINDYYDTSNGIGQVLGLLSMAPSPNENVLYTNGKMQAGIDPTIVN